MKLDRIDLSDNLIHFVSELDKSNEDYNKSEMHPKEYATDKQTWIQLYKDYTGMGMNQNTTITVISEIFNKDEDTIKSFLKKNGVI